jgi:hypothetical protein
MMLDGKGDQEDQESSGLKSDRDAESLIQTAYSQWRPDHNQSNCF